MTEQLDTPDDFASDGDEDFAELESLINPKPAKPDGLDELEELLGEAMASKLEHDRIKEARAKSKSGFGNTPEDLERIRRWELANEWRSAANVAFFERNECACGKHHTVFQALMLRQIGRANPKNIRWTAFADSDRVDYSLPRETAIRVSKVPMCQVCSADQGYSLVTDWTW